MHHGGVLAYLPIHKCLILLGSALHLVDYVEEMGRSLRVLLLVLANPHRAKLCLLA